MQQKINIITNQTEAKTMTCTETTHEEYIKAMKKFCPECGHNFVLEQLNGFIGSKPVFKLEELYKYVIDEQLVLKENIVFHGKKFHYVDAFVKQYPFMQFPNDFKAETKCIYMCKDFARKARDFELGIPIGIHTNSAEFMKQFGDYINDMNANFPSDDEEKIVKFMIEKMQIFFKSTKQKTIEKYLLQDCIKNGNKIYHENGGTGNNVKDFKISFTMNSNSVIRALTTTEGKQAIITQESTAYWFCPWAKCTDIAKIREWFNTRPSSWIRDKELEEEYLKQYC